MTIQKMTGRQASMEAVPQFPALTYVLGLQESIVAVLT